MMTYTLEMSKSITAEFKFEELKRKKFTHSS